MVDSEWMVWWCLVYMHICLHINNPYKSLSCLSSHLFSGETKTRWKTHMFCAWEKHQTSSLLAPRVPACRRVLGNWHAISWSIFVTRPKILGFSTVLNGDIPDMIYPYIPHITVFHWNRCFLTDKVPSGSGPIFSKAVRDRMPCPSHFLPSCRLLHGLSRPILAHEDCQEAPLVRRATGSSHCFHPSLAEGLFLKRRLSKISQPYRTPHKAF